MDKFEDKRKSYIEPLHWCESLAPELVCIPHALFYLQCMDKSEDKRKSHIEPGTPCFWTATINGWKHLLAADHMKMEIIQSLQWLTQRQLIAVYAYVIMPNHIHLLWTVKEKNGRESPQGSLLKFTAHRFRQFLYESDKALLQLFEVDAPNKFHEFWQRDSLAISIYSRPFLLQKITYIHNNPVAKHWKLAICPEAYRFSSASFYETGNDEFNILTHLEAIF